MVLIQELKLRLSSRTLSVQYQSLVSVHMFELDGFSCFKEFAVIFAQRTGQTPEWNNIFFCVLTLNFPSNRRVVPPVNLTNLSLFVSFPSTDWGWLHQHELWFTLALTRGHRVWRLNRPTVGLRNHILDNRCGRGSGTDWTGWRWRSEFDCCLGRVRTFSDSSSSLPWKTDRRHMSSSLSSLANFFFFHSSCCFFFIPHPLSFYWLAAVTQPVTCSFARCIRNET